MLIYKQILKARARRWRGAPGASIPTVCVGNVTVGGTGKTPHTELILSLLQASGRWGNCQLGVLSRGYRRKSRGFQYVQTDSPASFAGDEPLQIKKKFPAVTVAVDRDRVEGCERLASDGVRLVVLDDSLQFRRLHASLNIVLVDWSRPVFSDSLLPFGRLRDLPGRIFDADIIIVSKCPRVLDDWDKVSFTQKLRLHAYDASECAATAPSGKRLTVLFSHMEYCPLEAVFPEADPRYAYAGSAVTITGIANDAPMKAWLSDSYKLAASLSYPDHHRFSRGDVREMASAVRHHPTSAFVTTEKDAQRLRDCGNLPEGLKQRLFALPIKAAFSSERELEVFGAYLNSSSALPSSDCEV